MHILLCPLLSEYYTSIIFFDTNGHNAITYPLSLPLEYVLLLSFLVFTINAGIIYVCLCDCSGTQLSTYTFCNTQVVRIPCFKCD